MGEKYQEAHRNPNFERSEYFLGMVAALCRAAIKARRRAVETTGSVPTWRDRKLVNDTEV